MSATVLIENVRASFPHIAKPNTKFGPDGKRELTVMMHKENDAEVIAKIEKLIEGFTSSLPESKKITDTDKICLKDGDNTGRPEYAGHMVLKGSSKGMVPVFNTRKEQIDAGEADIQGGDWVSAQMNIWLQDNAYGQRVNCELIGVQFIRAESFGGKPSVDQVMNGFNDVESDEF